MRHVYALAVAEDIATYRRAKAACRDLALQFGEDCSVVEHDWLLSVLRFPELRTIAADEASSADLIIISIHHDTELPVEIREWIDLWLGRNRARPAILLALVDDAYEEDDPDKPAHPCLEELARRGNVDILIQSAGPDGNSGMLEVISPQIAPQDDEIPGPQSPGEADGQDDSGVLAPPGSR